MSVNVDAKIYPRERIDEEVVEIYKSNLETGMKFPRIVVQKDTYTLVDGLHRFKALEKLGKKQVEVEILDIPNIELRREAISRNIKHGKRLTKDEIRRNVIALRFTDKKRLKEIAETVGLSEARISQICEDYHLAHTWMEFNDLSSKVPKVDLRMKVDSVEEKEILTDLRKGVSGKEVAEKHGVSQPTVSRIKKKHEEWVSSPVYIRMKPVDAIKLFQVAFANGVLEKARFEFKEGGVLIRNSNDNKPPSVFAMFKKDSFFEYRVIEPVEGYAESDLLAEVSKHASAHMDYELALINPQTWNLRYKTYGGERDNVKTHAYEHLDWRGFTKQSPKLDEDGIPETAQVKAKIHCGQFARKHKGNLALQMKDGELFASFDFECGVDLWRSGWDWKCNREFELEFLEKKANATAIVDHSMLDQIIKTLTWYGVKKGKFIRHSGPFVWIGMWTDRTNLAIGTTGPTKQVCFIL